MEKDIESCLSCDEKDKRIQEGIRHDKEINKILWFMIFIITLLLIQDIIVLYSRYIFEAWNNLF